MKKLLVLLLAFAMLFCFAACGGEDEPEETKATLNKGDENCQHVWTEWDVEKEASCTKAGFKSRECETCGKQEQEELLAFGHMYDGGNCVTCGKQPKECEHPETYPVTMSEATCDEYGEKRYVCKMCKAVVDETYIVPFGHTEETVTIKEADCYENGLAQDICTVCGEITYEYTLWSYGHGETENVVVKEATCTEDGQYQEICTVCGDVAYEGYIWSNGHEYEYISAQNPTCTEIGWYNYRQCKVCNYLYNYEERPATGHSYQLGVCTSCGAEDATFHSYTAPSMQKNELNVAQTEAVVYKGVLGNIYKDTSGNMADKSTVESWTLDVVHAGRFYIWLDDIYSGYYLKLYVYDANGTRVANDSSIYNKDGIYMDLAVGTYTVEVTYGNGVTTFNMNAGMAKPAADISNSTSVSDAMEFPRQKNAYTFTAPYTGVYSFSLNEMLDGAYMYVSLYNRLNERVSYDSSVRNGEYMKVDLTAGETYTLYIENNNNYITPYVLGVGQQKPVTSVDGYNHINDQVTFAKQTNVYTFVATTNDYRLELTNMTSDMRLDIYLYNYLNERLSYTTYGANGTGLSFHDLVAGQTYTIKVVQNTGFGSYTLRVLSPKYGVAVKTNTAVVDKMEYYSQVNYYDVTAGEGGQLSLKLYVDSYEGTRYLAVYVYGPDGYLVTYDDYFYNGDTLTIDATAGAVYTYRVIAYNGTMDYCVEFH